MAYSRDYPNSIIPKGSKVVECLQNDDKELKRILGILSDIGVMSLFGSKRQCVLHAATGTDGKPSYLTANGLNVAINGSTTPVIVTFAGGYNANGTVDKTDTIVDTVNAWTMPANGTYYLYIDKDMSTGILSYGYTTIPDTYATTAPASPALDQCYFNTVDMMMYHYNSSAWEQKLRVFVAKAVTTDSAATLTMYPFTSRATPSNLVQYDSDGNLQVVDNAGALAQLTASKFIGAASTLATPRTIALSGKVTGTATSFDGSGNIAIPVTAVTADSCAGNSATANKWATARTLTLTGNTTGSASIDGSGDVSLATSTSYATKATQDQNGLNISDTYLKRSGGSMSGALNFANETWNLVGDDCYMGDCNHGGMVGFKGANDITGIVLVHHNDDGNYATITYDGGNINFSKTLDANISGNSDTVDGWHLQSILDQISASNTGGIVAQSLGANGYAKWSTGLILQWGTLVATGSAYTDISFPISFPNNCFNVQKTSTSQNDSAGNERYLRTFSKTGFHAGFDSSGGCWLAIGN